MRPARLYLAVLTASALGGTRAGRAAEPFALPAVVQSRTALTAKAPATRVEDLPGGLVVVSPAPFQPAIHVDARYRWRFSQALWVYAPQIPDGPALTRIVTIHYTPDDAEVSQRTARLCARLWRLHCLHLQRRPRFGRGSSEANLWLTRNTPDLSSSVPGVGGETWDNHAYLFATGAERTPIEWVRTVAHEWGHLTLPGARGFVVPENDASGFLGERLYLKWLREETRNSTAHGPADGVEVTGLNTYHARQITPLIARFQAVGPRSPDLDGTSRNAMDLYIGAALAADETLGSALLGRALFTVLGLRARDFVRALQTAVAQASVLPVRLPAWVPLSQTTYTVRAAPAGRPGTVAFADRPPFPVRGRTGTKLRVQLPGWKWVRATSGGVQTITLERDVLGKATRP